MLQYNDLNVETVRHQSLVLCLLCYLDSFTFFFVCLFVCFLKKFSLVKYIYICVYIYIQLIVCIEPPEVLLFISASWIIN